MRQGIIQDIQDNFLIKNLSIYVVTPLGSKIKVVNIIDHPQDIQ